VTLHTPISSAVDARCCPLPQLNLAGDVVGKGDSFKITIFAFFDFSVMLASTVLDMLVTLALYSRCSSPPAPPSHPLVNVASRTRHQRNQYTITIPKETCFS